MSEFVEIFKMVLENPSPLMVSAVVFLMIYKSKDLFETFFQMKDINKKRIIQKLEETKNFNEKNYLDSLLSQNYERLCEEAQLHAIIGCQYCSKEMAQYILTRKNISRAIRIYHRVKDDIKITNGDISLLKNRSDRKIKVYKNIGTMLYWLLGGIGSLALAIFPIANSFVGVFIFIALLAMGFFILIKSMKPELTKIFCELELIEKTVITESNKSSKAA